MNGMDRNSFSAQSDWIVLSARWVSILAVSFWLVLNGNPDWVVLLILAATALGNLALTAVLANRSSSAELRMISTIGDFILATVIFYLTLNNGQNLAWVGFLPLLTAALYYQWIGAISIILANILLQGVMLTTVESLDDTLLMVGILLPISILVGFGLAYFSVKMKSSGGRWGIQFKSCADAHQQKRAGSPPDAL